MQVMIVEDNDAVRFGITNVLQEWGAEVFEASTEQEALLSLDKVVPDLLLIDVRLGENGSGVTVAEKAAQLKPVPMMLAISGEATPLEAFRMAQAGVSAFIPKPIDLNTFSASIELVLQNPPNFLPQVATQVGKKTYYDIVRNVRKTMLEQALARTGGNKVQAAKLLDVSRQAVQQMIHDFE
jgi:DNA-binding NtrC family response regulator